jgi:hypothetical protein
VEDGQVVGTHSRYTDGRCSFELSREADRPPGLHCQCCGRPIASADVAGRLSLEGAFPDLWTCAQCYPIARAIIAAAKIAGWLRNTSGAAKESAAPGP